MYKAKAKGREEKDGSSDNFADNDDEQFKAQIEEIVPTSMQFYFGVKFHCSSDRRQNSENGCRLPKTSLIKGMQPTVDQRTRKRWQTH